MTGMRPALLVCVELSMAGCDAPECEALSDCEGDEICVDELCHKRAGGRLPTFDMGVRDTGVKPDSGSQGGDAGMGDAAGVPPRDGGSADSGSSSDDGGVGSLPTEGDLGFVWAGELISGENTSAFHAFGLLQRLDGATFSESHVEFQDGEASACTLSTRRLTGGAIAGFEADSISVIPGPTPFSPFSMYPIGNGRFEPSADPVQRLYNKSRTAYFQIYGTGNAGSVEGMLVGVSAPPYVFNAPEFPRGQPISISPSPQLLWVPSDLTDGTITIELFDSVREVVLTCRVMDDGSYVIPNAAVSAFLDAQPMPSVYLEIRYDRESSSSASIAGGGMIPVTYRASQGLRYPVALP